MLSLLKVPKNYALLWALFFTILIYLFEEWVFAQLQGKYLKGLQPALDAPYLIGLLSSCLAFMLVVIGVWLSLMASPTFKVIYGLFFSAMILGQYGYWQALNRFAAVSDLQVALASPPDLWFTAIGLFFNRYSLIPICIYLLLLYTFRHENLTHWREFGAFGITIIILVLTIRHLPLQINKGISITQFVYTTIELTSAQTKIINRIALPTLTIRPPVKNIILIVDESIRSDHLSLNHYSRPTTPYLQELSAQGHLYNWGTASSGATCSPLSNAMLMTGLMSDPHILEAIYEQPTVFQYAKALGYKTTYIDAQTNHLWNGLQVSDLRYVDNWLKSADLGSGIDRDLNAADYIAQLVKSEGNFIMLNKKGVHFLYEDSYPPEQLIWGPLPSNYYKQPELAVNPYDNGIVYNVDLFFRHLLPDNNIAPNNWYIYTSDHGQTLFEGGESWLHCNFTKREAAVPLFIIGHLPTAPDTTYNASHSNILPTILDLMEFPEPITGHSLLSPKPLKQTKRYFYSGNLDKVAFDE